MNYSSKMFVFCHRELVSSQEALIVLIECIRMDSENLSFCGGLTVNRIYRLPKQPKGK